MEAKTDESHNEHEHKEKKEKKMQCSACFSARDWSRRYLPMFFTVAVVDLKGAADHLEITLEVKCHNSSWRVVKTTKDLDQLRKDVAGDKFTVPPLLFPSDVTEDIDKRELVQRFVIDFLQQTKICEHKAVRSWLDLDHKLE